MPARYLRCLFLCCLSIFLSACSSTSFVYNRLDFLLPWYVDGYTNLNVEQEQFLDERLSPFLEWHRSMELPCYVGLLEGVEASLDDELADQDIARVSRGFELAWYRTQDEAMLWLLELGERLSDKQVQQFLEELSDKQEDFEQEYLERTDEEFYDDSYDNMVEQAKKYLGRLNKPQREKMRTASEKMRRSDALWLRERARFIADLTVEMEREPGWQDRVVALMERQVESPAQDYMAVLDHNVGVIQVLAADILNERTDAQDRHLKKELGDLRSELNELIAQSEKPSACMVPMDEPAAG